MITSSLGPFTVPNQGGLIPFEVQEACEGVRKPVMCGVTFDKVDNVTIRRLGGFAKGQCEPNPDIAGIGVLIGLTPNFLLCLFALWIIAAEVTRGCRGNSGVSSCKFPIYQRIFRELPRSADKGFILRAMPSLILIISDAATLLGLAYYFNFMLAAKCSILTYHYYVALDIILFTCSTIVIATLLSRAYYWRSLAAACRFLLALTHFFFVGLLLFYQSVRAPRFPEWLPPDVGARNDSALLLPVSCFLDPDLIKHHSPFRPSWSRNKTAVQINRIGPAVDPSRMPEFVLYVLLLLCFLAMHASTLLRWCLDRWWRRPAVARQPNALRPRGPWRSAVFVGCWLSVMCLCIISDVICVYHVVALRTWVHASGWMTVHPVNQENDVNGLGQLVSLFGLGAIVLVVLEHCDWGRIRTTQGGVFCWHSEGSTRTLVDWLLYQHRGIREMGNSQ